MPFQTYTPRYTQTFMDCLEKHREQQERALELVSRITKNPTVQSHFLDNQKGIDLRGKRRRHMSGNFVVVYIVCEECFNLHHRGKYNNCACCTGKVTNWIIFLAFAKWNDIYSRNYVANFPTDFKIL